MSGHSKWHNIQAKKGKADGTTSIPICRIPSCKFCASESHCVKGSGNCSSCVSTYFPVSIASALTDHGIK